MSNHKPLISVVIVNYDTPKLTFECLASVQSIKSDGFDYNIIVVDNGSQKELKIPTKLRSENLELIRTDNNIGFTGGNNLGISYTVKRYNPDYFLLLNSDTTVTPTFLNELFLALQGEDRGIAVSKIYFEKGYEFHQQSYKKNELGKIIWFAGGTIDWPNLTAFHRGVDEVDYGQFDHLEQTDFATGCCMLIKRELIEHVGILDKRYFLYLEDVDYSIRAIKKGYKIVFCPKSVIYHKNAGSSGGSGSILHQYYQTRNRLFFFLKYATLKHKLTAIRLSIQLLFKGLVTQRKAVLNLLLGKMGKQPIV